MPQSGFAIVGTRRFGFLCLAQFLGIFSDNVAKSAIAVLLLFGAGADGVAAAVATALFILPYALFAPLAGRLADRYAKHRVARAVKLLELPVMLFAGFAIWSGRPPLMLAAMFFAGMQATLFSPVKYGILPELVAGPELVSANALVEGGTFLAILVGTIAGGIAGALGPSPVALIALGVSSGVGAIAIFRVPRTEMSDPELTLSLVPFAGTGTLLRSLKGWRRAHAAAVALSWFWMAGAVLLAEIPTYARQVLRTGPDGATILLAALAAGIGAGSMAYGAIAQRRGAGAAIPAGFLGMALATAAAALIHASGTMALIEGGATLFAAAFCGGLLSVPLYVALQQGAPAEARARAVSGNNLLNAIYMVIGSVAAAGIGAASGKLGLDASGTVRLILIGAAATSALAIVPACLNIPEAALAVFGRLLLLVYQVQVRGIENLEKAGLAAVITPNHVSWIDGALLAAALPGRPAFAVNSFTARKWWARWAVGLVEALPVDPTSAMAIKTLIREVRAGRQCVIFPEGRLTRTGSLMKIYDGPALVADKAGAPIVPVRIEGAQHSFWTRLGGVYRRRSFPKITITILPPARLEVAASLVGMARREALSRNLYDRMTDAALRSYDADLTVFNALLDAAAEHGPREILEDQDRAPTSYGGLVTASLVLGRKLTRWTGRGDRVGILLPNSTACVATLFGLQAFGRVPAMLNYSTGAESMATALAAATIRTVVTSRRFVELGKLDAAVARLGGIAEILYLEDIRAQIGGLARLRGLVDRLFAHRVHRTARQTPDMAALVLFTSGSEGTPKGVVLSHSNLLSNAGQAAARVAFNPNDVVLNALPVFHSFGMTAGLILPLLSGIKTVLYPNPLHYRRIPELAYDSGATILFGTDTFLAGYARKAHPYDFHTLRYVFAGAERVRAETRRVWADKFGVRILEGYGSTESGPVIAINTPMHAKDGTVGRILPGIRARLEPVPGVEEGGRLHVSGPNIMMGYLRAGAPGVVEAPRDGWYDTGDIVAIDSAGYVTIIGRAKRFAKLAGEMVSLAAVEEWAGVLWPESRHAAVALPDQRKGERIVLLSTRAGATRPDIAAFMRARALPDIAVPAEIIYSPEIPSLCTGKTDYGRVKEIAERPRMIAVA
jgi:acyl-[acyl-carrier-protein]-phospholipid O-acyltransferase/long-chain-fatty-acid--[acyl-carrier-protein] ligase